MLTRKKGIFISLALTIVVLCVIFVLNNQRHAQDNREVEVAVTNKPIPVGQGIKDSDIEKVKIPERMAGGLVKFEKDKPLQIIGKAPSVTLIKGQYIWENCINNAQPQTNGFPTVFIPTDLSSSACVVAGERVNIHLVDKSSTGIYQAREPIYKGALVRYSRDSANNEIDPVSRSKLNEVASGGGKVPVSVGLDVPSEIERIIVDPASKKAIYLTLSEVKG